MIAVLALILGGIAVTNTMAMAILERRRELTLMSAIGWSRPQVAGIVVGEGAGVGLIGAGLGVLGGILISHLIVNLLGAGGFVDPELTAWGIGRGLLVGLAIGVMPRRSRAWSSTERTDGRCSARSLSPTSASSSSARRPRDGASAH